MNKFNPTVYGIGFMGDGIYGSKDGSKQSRAYRIWHKIMERSYSSKLHILQPSYKDCEVCEEWHNFQNFAKWYSENYYKIDDEDTQIDKDIIIKNNKIYSPSTCVFVNHHINSLFTRSEGKRGEYPIGVTSNGCGKYNANYLMKKKVVHVGVFRTPEEAFVAYKIAKEGEIKRVADLYKSQIPNKLYLAMYDYEVAITD